MHEIEIVITEGQVNTKFSTSKEGLKLMTLEGHLEEDPEGNWIIKYNGWHVPVESVLNKFEGKKVRLSLELI